MEYCEPHLNRYMFQSILKIIGIGSLAILTTPNLTDAQDMIKHVHQILVYGAPPDPLYQNAEKVVGRKWNIEQVAVAGCVVSESLHDSVTNHNRDTYDQLAVIYGADWQGRFLKEIEAEYKNEKTIAEWIDQNKAIQTKLEKFPDAFFVYEMFPVSGTNMYDVKVNNIETWEDRTSSVTYMRLRVNMDTEELKITNETKAFNFAYE